MHMGRTTILADDELMLEIKHLAFQQGKTFTQVAQEAFREYLTAHRPAKRRISFAGIARSGQPDLAERVDEILMEEIDPITGWSPGRAETSEAIPEAA